jgi:hypothetical protein
MQRIESLHIFVGEISVCCFKYVPYLRHIYYTLHVCVQLLFAGHLVL